MQESWYCIAVMDLCVSRILHIHACFACGCRLTLSFVAVLMVHIQLAPPQEVGVLLYCWLPVAPA